MDPILTQLNSELETAANEASEKAASGDLEGAQAAQKKMLEVKSRLDVYQSAASIKSFMNTPVQATNSLKPELVTSNLVAKSELPKLTF